MNMRTPARRPSRKHPHRLERWKYQMLRQPVGFTVCAAEQGHVLTRSGVPEILIRALHDAAQANGCTLIAYCIMPEHLHLLACVVEQGGDLISFLERFSQASAYALTQRGIDAPVWQRGFWDRHVRDSEDLGAVIEYLLANPVRRGLCQRPGDWPHARFCGYPWQNNRRG